MEQGRSDLEGIATRLERIADELASQPSEERAAELVREASELAAGAGRTVDSALQAAAQSRDA
jgi:hypothetical protein